MNNISALSFKNIKSNATNSIKYSILICLVCIIPLILMLFGFDLDLSNQNVQQGQELQAIHLNIGGEVYHSIMEVISLIICIGISALSLFFYIKNKYSLFAVSFLAFYSTAIFDLYHILASLKILNPASELEIFIPFTWAISRAVSSFVLMYGLIYLLFLRSDHSPMEQKIKTNFLIGIFGLINFVLFIMLSLVHSSNHLPQVIFKDAIITRPWEVLAILFYSVGGLFSIIHLKFEKNIFIQSIVLSLIANLMTHFFMLIGAENLYDSMFNIAHYTKLISYTIPLIGLVLDFYFQKNSIEDENHELKKAALISKVIFNLDNSSVKNSSENMIINSYLINISKEFNFSLATYYSYDGEKICHTEIWCHDSKNNYDAIKDVLKNIDNIMTFKSLVKSLNEKRSIWSKNISNDTFLEDTDSLDSFESAIITPIKISKKVVGIMLFFKEEEDLYTSRSIRAFDQLSDKIGQSLNRRELERGLVKAVREAEFYRRSIDASLIILQFDESFNLVECNQNSINILSLDKDKNRRFESIFHLQDKKQEQAILSKDKEFWQGILECKVSKKSIWLESVLTKKFNQFNQVNGYMLIAYDVTERKSQEDELNRSREEALVAVSSKNQFLSMMSHELRTPMNAIIGFTQILEDKLRIKSNKEILENIKLASNSLEKLIDNILSYSKADLKKLKLLNKKFDLYQLCSELYINFKHSNTKPKVSIELDIKPNVPQFVKGDETRIKQVLINLMDNGLKFTDQGVVKLEVSAKVINGKAYLELLVSDTGMGVGDAILEDLVKPFFKNALEDKIIDGGGLGLTVADILLKQMNGKLSLLKLSQGCCFKIKLNLELANEVEENINLSKSSKNLDFDLSQLNILVAEDNKLNQKLMKVVLMKANSKFEFASNGLEACNMVKENNFDLVLMDVHMPKMNGIEATKEIRTMFSKEDLPIIAITANAFEEDKNECLEAGMNDFLSKPLKFDTFKGVLMNIFADRINHLRGGIMPGEINQEFKNHVGDDAEMFMELLDELKGDLPEMLNGIEKAILNSDYKELEITAHTLKGVVKNFYITDIEELAFKLEQLGRNQSLEGAIDLLDQIKISYLECFENVRQDLLALSQVA